MKCRAGKRWGGGGREIGATRHFSVEKAGTKSEGIQGFLNYAGRCDGSREARCVGIKHVWKRYKKKKRAGLKDNIFSSYFFFHQLTRQLFTAPEFKTNVLFIIGVSVHSKELERYIWATILSHILLTQLSFHLWKWRKRRKDPDHSGDVILGQMLKLWVINQMLWFSESSSELIHCWILCCIYINWISVLWF